MARALSKRYYWHKMNDLIKRIVMSCHDCQVSRMRLQRLSLEFAEADANQLPLPRQKYGIDFHGHAKGEILVATDLVTREVCLWLLPNRKQEVCLELFSLDLSLSRESHLSSGATTRPSS